MARAIVLFDVAGSGIKHLYYVFSCQDFGFCKMAWLQVRPAILHCAPCPSGLFRQEICIGGWLFRTSVCDNNVASPFVFVDSVRCRTDVYISLYFKTNSQGKLISARFIRRWCKLLRLL